MDGLEQDTLVGRQPTNCVEPVHHGSRSLDRERIRVPQAKEPGSHLENIGLAQLADRDGLANQLAHDPRVLVVGGEMDVDAPLDAGHIVQCIEVAPQFVGGVAGRVNESKVGLACVTTAPLGDIRSHQGRAAASARRAEQVASHPVPFGLAKAELGLIQRRRDAAKLQKLVEIELPVELLREGGVRHSNIHSAQGRASGRIVLQGQLLVVG